MAARANNCPAVAFFALYSPGSFWKFAMDCQSATPKTPATQTPLKGFAV
jgi:hypothetical protein